MSASSALLRILTLDGGGAKGFYTLGVLKEIEAMVKCPLHQKFDLVFGTSTGAIIGALIALDRNVDSILQLYREHVPDVMSKKTAAGRSQALKNLATKVFGNTAFNAVKTNLGIVTADWRTGRPMIFKSNVDQAHERVNTFVPGFGVSIADAVKASCSAYPLFKRTIVKTSMNEDFELIDGGYCANNPTLYAIADAVQALKSGRKNIQLVSVGVGAYPEPSLMMKLKKNLFSGHLLHNIVLLHRTQLVQKTLEIKTQSMDQLRQILFHDIPIIRISDAYVTSDMATDLLEHDLDKLNILFSLGRKSFESREQKLREYLR